VTCAQIDSRGASTDGPAFMQEFRPLMTASSKNGGFVDACIIHGSTTSKIDNLTGHEAFNAWIANPKPGSGEHWHIMKCNGSEDAGPCDTAEVCAPFP
jgi:hypothetical protein